MREIISQRDPGDENDYKEISMNELEKQIEKSEEELKRTLVPQRVWSLLLRNQIVIMKHSLRVGRSDSNNEEPDFNVEPFEFIEVNNP